MKITEIDNKLPKNIKPIKEVMSFHIPDIDESLPNKNGFIWFICGSAGSGKSSMLMNLFKNKKYFRNKFDNLFYFCPEGSYLSVKQHPFSKHDKVYHEISPEILDNISDELIEIKNNNINENIPQEYSAIIIDDMGDRLKEADMINSLRKHCIKSRHINCAFIFVIQGWMYLPLTLRKLVFNTTIFKPRNNVEKDLLRKEVLNMTESECNDLFDYVFDAPFNFLTIDNVDGNLSKNFNKLVVEKKVS
jgi:hypothetical protein